VPLRSRVHAIVLALVFAITLSANAQDDQLKTASKQELDIIKVLVAQEDAWNKGDLQAFIQGYKNSPDTLFVTHQVFRGVDGMLDEYRHNYPSRAAMGTLGFSELEVHPLDEKFAVVIGKYHLDRGKKDGGNADGIFSLVFEKTDQGWKIIVDHTT
jgi:ketosteroid isomerase-like protein